MKKLNGSKQRGFTLVELLIVVAILGITMGAIYSLYTTHQRSAYVSDEIVEVQQNLRIALNSMTREIRMGGLVTPRSYPIVTPTTTQVSSNSTATDLTLNIGAIDSGAAFAVIAQNRDGLGQFIVTTQESVDQFTVNNIVTIVRPNMNFNRVGDDPAIPSVDNRFRVKSTDRAIRMIELEPSPGPPASVDINATYKRSDYIVRSGALFPNQIRYCLSDVPGCVSAQVCPAGQTCLIKMLNGAPGDIIAQNIAPTVVPPGEDPGLRISYLLENLPETNAPALANFNIIRAVRVSLTGRTAATIGLSGNVPRERQVESIIEIKN
jgi:prepilin-type N-terminal cleavage/methylation domain-containing protein